MERQVARRYGTTTARTKRYTTGRTANKQPEQHDGRETLVMQCIVCGVILLSLMTLRLIKADFAQNLRVNLKSAIQQGADIEEVKEDMENWYQSAKDTLNNVFGKNKDGDVLPEQQVEQNQVEETVPVSSPDFRIDEDIIMEMNESRRSVAEEKKP